MIASPFGKGRMRGIVEIPLCPEKIPLNPPFSKGEMATSPFAKGET